MAYETNFFEPKLGRSCRDTTRRKVKTPARLMQRVARSGSNPRRLGSIIPAAKRAPSGRYNARGRGAKIAAAISSESGWSVDHASGSRFRMRRVTVKARYVKAVGRAQASALPVAGDEAKALGQKRYDAFLDSLARMIAGGERSVSLADDEPQGSKP